MSNKENVKIISARPEDADFIAWIVAQGMHMDGVPKKHGARENTLYSWQNTRLLRCDGKLAGGLISYDGATSMKEMGKVMGTASKQLAGKADGRVISEIVKKLLA